MKHKTAVVTALLLSLFILTSCDNSAPADSAESMALTFPENRSMNGAIGFNEGMIFGGDVRHINNFLDYNTMTEIPLCSKANCKHNDTTCDGFIDTLTWTYWNGYIYYVELATDFTDEYDWDHCCLWRCSLDGTDRQRVIDLGQCVILYGYVVGNTAYFGCSSDCYPEEEPDEEMVINRNCYITEVNLDKEEITYTSEYFCKAKGAEVNLWGVYKNKLYLYAAGMDNFDTENGYQIYTYDLKTHEFAQNNDKAYALYGDYIIYQGSPMTVKSDTYTLDTGLDSDSTNSFSRYGDMVYFCSRDNGRLYRINLLTGEMQSSDRFDFSSDTYSTVYANADYIILDLNYDLFQKYSIAEMNFKTEAGNGITYA